ncbi:hypothetical protein [Alphaproteobacteria bacterium endosymbiont of Tiliacea citrago]|uniref:hypothetical protein n=1 Tax=Alphaproteobacteria bacterium endosymbiont of Tiliacea citrago TaxID=3077944 RepID=UPI00313DAD1C
MKKIVMLALSPVFLNAGFTSSVMESMGRSFGESLGGSITASRWFHLAIELGLSVGGMSKIKESDIKNSSSASSSASDYNKTSGDFSYYNKSDNSTKTSSVLEGHPLFKMGVGFKVYSGLGTENFQIGSSVGYGYLLNNSYTLDWNLYFFARHSVFFTRLFAGFQYLGCRFEAGKTKLEDELSGFSGFVVGLQLGYVFYESFYVALSCSYANLKNGEATVHEDMFKNIKNGTKASSVSVNLSIGMLSNAYSEAIKGTEELAKAKELAKLEARAEFEKRQKENSQQLLATKKQSKENVQKSSSTKKKTDQEVSFEDYKKYLNFKKTHNQDISFEEYKEYLKLTKNKANG